MRVKAFCEFKSSLNERRWLNFRGAGDHRASFVQWESFASPLALTSLVNANTRTSKVPLCLQRALQCNARATSKAILLLSFYRLRRLLKGSCV